MRHIFTKSWEEDQAVMRSDDVPIRNGLITKTSEKDIPAMYAIEQRCFAHPWDEQIFAKACEDGSRKYSCVAKDGDGQIVGYGHIRRKEDNNKSYHTSNLVVDEASRGQGYGKAMFAHLFVTAMNHGGKKFSLEVDKENVVAKKMYESCGFKSTREFEENGKRRYYMEATEKQIMDKMYKKTEENTAENTKNVESQTMEPSATQQASGFGQTYHDRLSGRDYYMNEHGDPQWVEAPSSVQGGSSTANVPTQSGQAAMHQSSSFGQTYHDRLSGRDYYMNEHGDPQWVEAPSSVQGGSSTANVSTQQGQAATQQSFGFGQTYRDSSPGEEFNRGGVGSAAASLSRQHEQARGRDRQSQSSSPDPLGGVTRPPTHNRSGSRER